MEKKYNVSRASTEGKIRESLCTMRNYCGGFVVNTENAKITIFENGDVNKENLHATVSLVGETVANSLLTIIQELSTKRWTYCFRYSQHIEIEIPANIIHMKRYSSFELFSEIKTKYVGYDAYRFRFTKAGKLKIEEIKEEELLSISLN